VKWRRVSEPAAAVWPLLERTAQLRQPERPLLRLIPWLIATRDREVTEPIDEKRLLAPVEISLSAAAISVERDRRRSSRGVSVNV
jgi:hypothetical protein